MLFPYNFCALCAPALYVDVATAQPENRHSTSRLAWRHSESASTRTISAERVCRAQNTFARRRSEGASTLTISAGFADLTRHVQVRTAPQRESPCSRDICAAPQRERFDTRNLRRGFAELKTHSHGATARALRHAQTPQRVRQAQDTFARRHSESASTRTISAEGWPSSRQVRTAPQRERFDTHDLRKGFTFVLQRLQMSETLRQPRNSQTLFPKMLRLPRIICISAKHAAPTTKNARQSHRMLRWPWNSAATHKSEDRRGATARAQF